ncbi:DegT/DnrJ/EryC1/StrS family aminotransferase [Salinispora arenicola]|uniref:DegT/DnrJ/EryC1/StrS family aminotransferase n=1 Tax=Salinispora arenicola TaxID=168697 RepID=UPI0027DBF4A9|nr:DegT/DnrJ/EryC1/StrS family aminotransferase [Salinispora arenicola]
MNLAVPAQVYDFPAEDIDFITGELRSMLEGGRYLTGGQVSARFEKAFSRQHGDLMASAVNSGTAALEAILTSVDVRGGEVIVPTNTFGATGFAVVRAGARPVFADMLPDFTVDPADVARRITDRTKAIVTVHIGGLVSPATLDSSSCAATGASHSSRMPPTLTAAHYTVVRPAASGSPPRSRSTPRR